VDAPKIDSNGRDEEEDLPTTTALEMVELKRRRDEVDDAIR